MQQRRIAVVLNCDGGTLRSMDTDQLTGHIRARLEEHGHKVTIKCTTADDLIDDLEAAGNSDKHDTLVVAGGDGTVSAGAGIAWRGNKIFGALPAGTMNLFSRSMGTPLDLNAAVEAIAQGVVRDCDIATANGRPFVHLFAVGLHPRAMKLRNRYDFSSRYGKMLASTRALFHVVRRPRAFWVDLEMEGKVSRQRLSALTISNNIMGEGHLPYAERLDGGKLGIYRSTALGSVESAKLLIDIIRGAWSGNDKVEFSTAQEVHIRMRRMRPGMKATIDGEVIALEQEVHLMVHPGELKLLLPPEGSQT